ncbi:MAG: helix-turn-helix domain-containing protein [Candidatus Micrarchaeia archaeon]|jgi:putative transcriptional regulator
MEELKVRIAGEITVSPNPGAAMKKWREVFNISQTELSEFLKISPSTISDYEGNRRKSPGIGVINRFVNALFELDEKRGGEFVKRMKEAEKSPQEYFEVFNFQKGISGLELAKALDAKCVACGERLNELTIFGATILDSLKVILELPYDSFVKIYSTTSQRALLFTRVETGRSPLVAVRVSPIKPSLVILHGIEIVDKLAIKIAESEGIPLLATKIPLDEARKALKQF